MQTDNKKFLLGNFIFQKILKSNSYETCKHSMFVENAIIKNFAFSLCR